MLSSSKQIMEATLKLNIITQAIKNKMNEIATSTDRLAQKVTEVKAKVNELGNMY